MFTRLALKDFQGVGRAEFPLSPGLTALLGDSRAGKSSCLRGLRWLCLGGPATGKLRRGTDALAVALKASGRKVTRRRGRGHNTYALDGEVFESVGTAVPGPVASLLNVSEVNFQGQHDPPFWLSLTPPDAARQLNAVIDLGLIDDTLARLASEVRKAAADEQACERREQHCRSHVESLQWVPGALTAGDALLEAQGRLDALHAARDALAGLLEDCRKAHKQTQASADMLDAADAMMQTASGLRSLQDRRDSLKSLLSFLRDAEGQKCRSEREVGRAVAELKELQGATCPLCGRSDPPGRQPSR